MLEKMQRKGNPSALLVGMQTGAATVENHMEFLQNFLPFYLDINMVAFPYLLYNICQK